MRPIKYRAWDKQKKRMLKVQDIAFSDDGELVSVYTAGPDFSNDEQALMGERADLDDVVLDQYTGMKDLYGTEIYEGDIIKVQETLDNGRIVCLSTIAKIYLDEDAGQWKCDGGFTGPLSEHANTASGSFINSMSGDYMANRCEVIDNVHENPELLEAEK